jgi:hypothetical protein
MFDEYLELPFSELGPYSAEWYERIRQMLGDSGCKQLGYYAIPPNFMLSVVVPIYDEETTALITASATSGHLE